MERTTIYLPEDLKAAVEREAKFSGLAVAEIIRRAVRAAVTRPKPVAGLFTSDEPIAARAEELLAGFGER